jgi:glycosyltransferase involved in cell wall biosynthesis
MRVAIDARLNAYRAGGIPVYTRQLLAAMAALTTAQEPPAAPVELLALQHYRQRQPLVSAPTVRRATLYTPPHHRYEQWTLPLELLPLRPDVLHCPDFIPPFRRPCPAVVTIHDLAFLHYPAIVDDAARRYYGQVRRAVWQADAVIAVSQATRADISNLLDLPPERVHVIYEAADPAFAPLSLAPGSQRRVNGCTLSTDSFLLFVSTLEPRKNLPTLLRALHLCRQRQPQTPYRLVLAGGRGWEDLPIFELVRDLRLYDAVVFLGHVAQADLRWLYNACRLYVNPSLYEGFGLPVLEAMACGAPVLISNTSSLPEVAGEAAVALPPHDVEAWATELARLWQDETARATLAQRGRTQAARFSWQAAARATLALYRDLARQPGAGTSDS